MGFEETGLEGTVDLSAAQSERKLDPKEIIEALERGGMDFRMSLSKGNYGEANSTLTLLEIISSSDRRVRKLARQKISELSGKIVDVVQLDAPGSQRHNFTNRIKKLAGSEIQK